MSNQSTIQQTTPEPLSYLGPYLFDGLGATATLFILGLLWYWVSSKNKEAAEEAVKKSTEKTELILKDKFQELNSNLIQLYNNVENLKISVNSVDKRMAAQEITQPLIQEMLKKDVNMLGDSVKKLEQELNYQIEMLNHLVELHNNNYPETPFIKPQKH
jgi:seryl-tRNA synthetase